MTYTVKYRRIGAKQWVTLKRIKGDGIIDDARTHRFFVADDETRYEVPMADMEFVFSGQRFLVIKQNMESQSGIALPVRR